MTIESLFRSGRWLSPWLSLAAPIVLVGTLMALKTISPGLFCGAVNSGGKETICGSDYSHFSIRLLQLLGLAAWMLLVIIAGDAVFQRRATRPAVIAWSVSALLFAAWVMTWFTLPVENSH